jgi:hypothetical protein
MIQHDYEQKGHDNKHIHEKIPCVHKMKETNEKTVTEKRKL